ncbi:Na+/H+ antiporter subunit A [Kurthia gibsonii]|uniref:Na+/H+ antiporter subunit A n=1 Tax=Kurthia gibsonii TaxID=33946 RepID=UPI0031B717D7
MNQVLLIFLPVLFALFVPLLYKTFSRIHTGWFVLLVPLTLAIYYARFIPNITEGPYTSTFYWVKSLDLSVTSYLDGLSLLFSLLITIIGSLVVLYSIFYLDRKKEQLHNFYFYLLMFMTAMLGVVQSDHLISLYLFWELTSISSFLLIGYWYNRDRSRFGALKSMMITVFGGLMMLGGFLLLAQAGGSYSIRELIANGSVIADSPYFIWMIVLILLGAFTKSAQFPFYIWLPDAMEAPTPVSAYLHSATMVKAGIYLVARLTPLFAVSEYWIWLVVLSGLITLFWGSFFAVKQTDLKGILAFSTVSQLGMIMAMLGAAGIAFHVESPQKTIFAFAAYAAIFHLVNHATFKGSLFMVAGIVDHETGTRDIRKLGGLMSLMPISFTIAAIGSLAMAGLPPFNGFLSKELFLTSMLSLKEFSLFNFSTWGPIFPWVAFIASIFTFVYCLYFLYYTFMGKGNTSKLPKKPHEAPIGMLISPIILASLVVAIFFIPNVIGKYFIKPAVLAMQPQLYETIDDIPIHVQAWHGWTTELQMTIGIVVIGFLLFITLKKWQPIYRFVSEKWSLNGLYNRLMRFADVDSQKLSNLYMTGSMRHYLMYMFAFMVVAVISTLFMSNGFNYSTANTAEVGIFEIATLIVMIIGTLTVLIARTRLTAIIALGAVGYSVALFFIIFNAPDLALTQLVIETVSVALFLLAFYHLPKMSRHEERMPFKINNFLIALGVGVMVTLVALSAQSQKLLPSISQYYKDTVYTKAGGGNIVNVILVDYRGFDTLFEITVLSIAGMAILGMIKLRRPKKEKKTHETK